MGSKTIIDWWSFVKGAGGFLIGFFFAQPVMKHITSFFQNGMPDTPSFIPSIIQFISTGTVVGVILLIILLISGLIFLRRIMTFVIWLLIGAFLAIVLDALQLHPLSLLTGLM